MDDTPVHKALREALANCLVNTDFYVVRGVVIKKDQDSIVMENLGYVRTGKRSAGYLFGLGAGGMERT